MGDDGLRMLQARIDADTDFAWRLRRIDPERFACELTAIAAELGFAVTEAEVHDAVASGRRAWALRWIR